MKIKNILTVFFVLQTITLLSQYSEQYHKFKDLYPDEDKVHLISETNVFIEIVNGEIEIKSKFFEEDLYLNNKANFYTKKSISYSSFFEISNLKASTSYFKKGKYKKLKVKQFSHKDELSGATFYDDTKKISFLYPNLTEGCKTSISFEENITDPHFLSSFYFQDYCPTIKTVYTITANKDIELIFKKYNLDSLNIVFSKNEKGDKVTFRWESKNMKKFEFESGATSFKNEIGHLIPYIASYKYKDKKTELLTGTKGLYNWYYSLVKDVNSKPSDTELIELVHSLVEGKDNDLEKVKAIYYWAQKNVKYVAFEYALGGFIPRNANDIFKNKYGDCKDNSSIMKEMMKIANIEGKLTWIGTRSIPYTYYEVPTPSVDNHMILTYTHHDSIYFLDATGRYYQFGLPSSFIQGKEALISLDSTNFLIKKVPVVPAKFNFLTDTSKLTISGNNIIGKGNVILNGYQKIDFFNILENSNTKEKIKTFYRQQFQKGTNKFLINDIKEINKYEYDKNFIVDYGFRINDYVLGNENEKYINLNLSKNISYYKIEKEKKYDQEYKYRNYSVYVNELEIPEGYSATYIPENLSIEEPKYSAHITYSITNNKIIYSYDITFDFIVINKNEHKLFNQFIEKIEKAFKESIVLTKNKSTTQTDE